MLDFGPGIAILVLIPGLCAFSALYGLFGLTHLDRLPTSIPESETRGRALRRAFAPAPPPANSIKTVTIVLVASIAIHALFAWISALLEAVRIDVAHSYPALGQYSFDLWRVMTIALDSRRTDSSSVAKVLGLALLQGGVAYALIRGWLISRARRNDLPAWLYGWPTYLANLLDDDDKIVLAWVVTDMDVAASAGQPAKTIVYLGVVHDLSVDADGAIRRINLLLCQRYAFELGQPRPDDVSPLARFASLTLDTGHIRNVAFELAYVDDDDGEDDRLEQ